MNILCIIPAYNAELNIRTVIEIVSEYSGNILVVDDGSTDETSRIVMSTRAALINHPVNRGKGAALKSGFAYALENDYEAVITLDADGQHNPKYIPSFLELYRSTSADMIIGSRVSDKADMPWDRRISNYLTSGSLSYFLGRYIEDSQCGFRLISRRLLESVRLESNRFELETEIIIKAVQQGFMIRFLPVKVKYGKKFPTSMNRTLDTLRWIKMVLEQI